MRTDEQVINYFKSKSKYDSMFLIEADLLDTAVEFLEMLPMTKIVRVEAGVKSGISDILVCYHGRFIAIELKDNTGAPTVQQNKFIQSIRDAGGKGNVCRTLADIYYTLIS